MFTHLHPLMLEYYSNHEDVERLATQIGIPVGSLRQSDNQSFFWYSLLNEAHKHDSVRRLIDIALSEYPERAEIFEDAFTHYIDTRKNYQKRVSAPKKAPEVADNSALTDATAVATKTASSQPPSVNSERNGPLLKGQQHRGERALIIFPDSHVSAEARPYVTVIQNTWPGEAYLLSGEVRRNDVTRETSRQYDWVIYIGAGDTKGWPLHDGLLPLEDVVNCIQGADAECVVLSTAIGGLVGLEIQRSTSASVIFSVEDMPITDALNTLTVFVQRYAAMGMDEAVNFLRMRTSRPSIYYLPSGTRMNEKTEQVIADAMARVKALEDAQAIQAAQAGKFNTLWLTPAVANMIIFSIFALTIIGLLGYYVATH